MHSFTSISWILPLSELLLCCIICFFVLKYFLQVSQVYPLLNATISNYQAISLLFSICILVSLKHFFYVRHTGIISPLSAWSESSHILIWSPPHEFWLLVDTQETFRPWTVPGIEAGSGASEAGGGTHIYTVQGHTSREKLLPEEQLTSFFTSAFPFAPVWPLRNLEVQTSLH